MGFHPAELGPIQIAIRTPASPVENKHGRSLQIGRFEIETLSIRIGGGKRRRLAAWKQWADLVGAVNNMDAGATSAVAVYTDSLRYNMAFRL